MVTIVGESFLNSKEKARTIAISITAKIVYPEVVKILINKPEE